MLQVWTDACMAIGDAALGALLGLSWTATLLAVALGTGLILALVRKFFTDQDLLRRAEEDRKRLGILIREARAGGDRDAVQRMKRTKAMIALRTFRQEGKPLLAAVLPIAVLATWCYGRLEFHPPAGGESVEVVFYAPVSAIGEPAHLVPQAGLEAREGWIRVVEEGSYRGQPTGVARWTVSAPAADAPHRLVFALKGRTYEHELLVGRRSYSSPWRVFDGGQADIEVRLRPGKLLGLIPGFGPWLPPWLIGYLAVVIPGAVVFRRLLRIS